MYRSQESDLVGLLSGGPSAMKQGKSRCMKLTRRSSRSRSRSRSSHTLQHSRGCDSIRFSHQSAWVRTVTYRGTVLAPNSAAVEWHSLLIIQKSFKFTYSDYQRSSTARQKYPRRLQQRLWLRLHSTLTIVEPL